MQNGQHFVPLNSFISAMLFATFNGYLQGRYLTEYAKYEQFWLRNPIFICGAIIFFTGMIINIHSDYLLCSLRRPGDYGYKVPKGMYMYNYQQICTEVYFCEFYVNKPLIESCKISLACHGTHLNCTWLRCAVDCTPKLKSLVYSSLLIYI